MKPADNKIYLASKSPRRRELLRQVGIDFELLLLRSDGPRGADVTEEVLPGESALDYVARVANEKAAFALNVVRLRHLPPRPVLAADTTVTIDGVILGKPADRAEAVAMLEQLSGRTHQVLTSIEALDNTPKRTCEICAALFVEHIEGSHSGIMGLPLYETAQLLRKAGLPLP